MHPEQYWDLLAPLLMDTEPVLPFPEESLETVPMGVYVQDLLLKDTYCDLILPRIGIGMRKTFEKRLLLYEQFRRRYAENHEILHAFKQKDVPVEICDVEGHWSEAATVGPYSQQERCVTVPVRLTSGELADVSIGMIIRPLLTAPEDDLTQSRGSNLQELLDIYNEKSRNAALAVGKDYCKPVLGAARVGNQRIVPITKGTKKGLRQDEGSEDEALREEFDREAKKRRGLAREHEERVAEITKKYCPGSSFGQSRIPGRAQDAVDAPDRLRLG